MQTVFQDFLAANSTYGQNAAELESLTQGLIDLKGKILAGQSEEDLYALVETILSSADSASSESLPAESLVHNSAVDGSSDDREA